MLTVDGGASGALFDTGNDALQREITQLPFVMVECFSKLLLFHV